MVAHNPPEDFEAIVRQCSAQVTTLQLIDNASASIALGSVRLPDNVMLTRSPENRGLAAALNDGVERALRAGARWILTMDHDTLLHDGTVRTMLDAIGACASADLIGVAAPRYSIRGKRPATSTGDQRCLARETVMMSANLVRAAAFERAGLFDSAFFIDYVDFDFCLRVRRAGLHVVELPMVVVDHRLGEVRHTSILGARVAHTHYQPRRRYLKARNRIHTYRRHFRDYPRWVFRDVWGIPWELASVALLEEEPATSLRAMLKGIIDGVLQATPPNPATTTAGMVSGRRRDPR